MHLSCTSSRALLTPHQANIEKCSYPGCVDRDCAGNRIEDEYDPRTHTHRMRVILPHHKNSRR